MKNIPEPETNAAAVMLGRKGGLASSKAKTAAARINARKGGWPKGKARKAAKALLVVLCVLFTGGCASPLAPSAAADCWSCDQPIYQTLPSGERIWWCEPWTLRACRIGDPTGRSFQR